MQIINKVLDLIKRDLNETGYVFTEEMISQLDIYCNFLIEYNQKVNLTAITDVEEIYIKHFYDSAAAQRYFKHGASVCDIGTGAGFPGVVLKIIRPDLKVYLVDSLDKRIKFLNELIIKLNLKEIYAMHYRAEDLEFKTKYLNSFDFVTARAVAKMNTLLEYCLPFVRVGGQFIAYKGTECINELNECKNVLKILNGRLNYTKKINLYNLYSRELAFIDKIDKTDSKYPRGQNKPKRKPL